MPRKVKIALVNPPTLKGVFRHQLYLPIGLGYLAAVLDKNGYEVIVIDCPALNIDHEMLREKLAGFEPNIVGITSMTPTIQSALLAAHISKQACPNALVILGGPHATFMDKEILNETAEVDVVARGEGELTMLDLANHVSSSKTSSLHDVFGITFRKNGQNVRTSARPFIENLDELPRPAYDCFSLGRYRLFGKAVLPIITSRGCPFQCSYCVTARMVGERFRARSPKNVVDELEWLRNVHGADAYSFYDDTLTLDKKRLFEICDMIKKRRIGVPWDCQTRVDQVSKEVLAKMRMANCQHVFFGVESGSQKMLNIMKKGTTVEQNERAIAWAKNVGLSVAVSVIIGYPGETVDTLKQTVDFIRRTEPGDAFLCVATPYPGTELYNMVKEHGWEMLKDWSRYDTTTPVFESPLLPAKTIMETRRSFYNDFYSPSFILRQSLRRTFYSQIMARTALNHMLWRIRLPAWVSANFKRLRVG